MYAVYAYKINPSKGVKSLEWMLLTNLPVKSFADASEKVKWYCLRWRIETYFKVLKSGFKIEECRLGNADKLIKFIAVMSVVAWKLFMLTLIARTDPEISCEIFIDKQHWMPLYLEIHKNKNGPKARPTWAILLGGLLCLGDF